MQKRVSFLQSSAAATTLPGWNDYEHKMFERLFLQGGVISGLQVTERGAGPNLSVDVSIGTALVGLTNTNVSHGKTYKVYFEGTGSADNLLVAAADPSNPRKDRVILRILTNVNPDDSSGNVGVIEVLTGTPAGSPSAPAEPANAITLAIFDVPAGATSITNARITDSRTYADLQSSALPAVSRRTELAALVLDLASTSNGKGASTIGIEDSANQITATTVEGALAELKALISAFNPLPTGIVSPWPTSAPPSGWLMCYGQAVSRTTYASLFAVLMKSATVTMTIASPCVITWNNHGLSNGDKIEFSTTGALPTGLSAGTTYYVINATTNTFNVSSTVNGSGINTSGSQSGTHTAISAPHGKGDGSTTFNLPDMRGRFPLGKDDLGGTAASRVTAVQALGVGSGGGTADGVHNHTVTGSQNNPGGVGTTVLTGSTGNSGAMPPYLTMNYIIKT